MVAESTTFKRQWTYSEIVALDNEVRYELYDGELVEMASPNVLHQDIIFRLAFLLETWVRKFKTGRVFLSPIDMYVSEKRCFVPDLCFYRQERFDSEEIVRSDQRCLIAPPDLVVEVISPSTARNDRILKSMLYADFGIQNYWIFEPEEKALQALVLTSGRYTITTGLTDDEIWEPPAFPGLAINLAELFAP